jgi:predicted nucleic acid-binding protein
MGPNRPGTVVLDAGALIAFERNDRKVRTLIELAAARNIPLHAPAGVVGQVWRDGKRQARLSRLLGSGVVEIQVLDREESQAAGVLCGKSKTNDVIDASVALLARRHGAKVVTSDPDDLRRIDPKLSIVVC